MPVVFHSAHVQSARSMKKALAVAVPKAERVDDTVLVSVDNAIATITLNRPRVRNALNAPLSSALMQASKMPGDPAVRAIILTGAGDKAFAAGADIVELNALTTSIEGASQSRKGQSITRLMEQLGTPIVAAVNGFALGGGCELAIAADIRIASDNAMFGQPEVKLGLIPGYGGTQRLSRLVGRGMAMYLCLTGEPIDAAEALRIGLVQRVVPQAELLAEARRVAGAIAAQGPLAVSATKHAIDEGIAVGITEALAIEALHFGSIVGTADFREGTQAF